MIDKSTAEEGWVYRAYGGAKPTDLHLLSTAHRIDDEIIAWLARRERRRRRLRHVRSSPLTEVVQSR